MNRVMKKQIVDVSGPCVVQQQFKELCDIKNVVARYQRIGGIPVPATPRQYLDLTTAPADYQQALNTVVAVKGHFDALPAKVRARFNGDPQAFLDYVADPKNRSELVDMGLANPAKADTATPPAASLPETKAASQMGGGAAGTTTGGAQQV